MSRLFGFGSVSALALLASAPAALADLTGAEVWNDWRTMLEAWGQTVTAASEVQDGGVLTVSGITMSGAMVDGSATASLDEIVFTEQGDGTVRVTFAPEYRIVTRARPEDGPETEATLIMRHAGLEMVARGDADEKTYDYTGTTIEVEVAEVTSDGVPEPVDMTVVANGVAGTYTVGSLPDGRRFSSEATVTETLVSAEGEDSDSGGTFSMGLRLADLASTSEGVLPAELDMSDLGSMLAAGMTTTGRATYGATSFTANSDGADGATRVSGTAEGGGFDFALRPEGLSYGTRSEGISFSVSGDAIPLPEITAAMAESVFRLTMPVRATDEPTDFGLVMAFRGVTVSDGIWGMFDPGAVFSRDPATIALDLTGTGRWLVDIMNPEAAASADAAPGELTALALNELEVSFGGASLTGSGEVAFDNTDTTTYDGVPKPVGSVDLRLIGANTMIDNLIELGFLPADQAMGARMMLGLFARPGPGTDELLSQIEFTEGGEVIANGQRLR